MSSTVHFASLPQVPEVDAVVPKPKPIRKSRPKAPAYGRHGPLVLGFAFSYRELGKRAFERLPELCADIDHLWPQAFKGWVRDHHARSGMLRMPTPAHAEKMQKILKCGEAQWYPDLSPPSKTNSRASIRLIFWLRYVVTAFPSMHTRYVAKSIIFEKSGGSVGLNLVYKTIWKCTSADRNVNDSLPSRRKEKTQMTLTAECHNSREEHCNAAVRNAIVRALREKRRRGENQGWHDSSLANRHFKVGIPESFYQFSLADPSPAARKYAAEAAEWVIARKLIEKTNHVPSPQSYT
ncbi:hypothetical protein GG344DRAFT_67198 [Lentinula edodes]|nr:hypothetical protein GG344DRAFT_67198 [Lentinula edodes]